MFSYKIFQQGSDTLLAIADVSIMGRRLEDGDIKMVVSRDFYGEKTCKAGEIKNLIKSATIINATGKQIVSLLKNEKLVDEGNILYINGVPHVQIINV